MTHGQTMLKIILPQAIRNILPATGNEFVINIKDTSVLNVISVTELFFASKSIAGTYMAYIETFTVTCVVYLVLTFTVTRILRALEKRMDGPSGYHFRQQYHAGFNFTKRMGTRMENPSLKFAVWQKLRQNEILKGSTCRSAAPIVCIIGASGSGENYLSELPELLEHPARGNPI
jgi:hypothetical protein